MSLLCLAFSSTAAAWAFAPAHVPLKPRTIIHQVGRLVTPVAIATEFGDIPAKVVDSFRYFDQNEFGAPNGFLDSRELRSALRYYGIDLSQGQVDQVMSAYDDNPSGDLDLGEYAQLVSDIEAGTLRGGPSAAAVSRARARQAAPPPPAPPPSAAPPNFVSTNFGDIPVKVVDAFRYFDSNEFGPCSGGLDSRELRSALRFYGLDMNQAQVEKILARYDIDRSGELDLGEFAAMVRDIEVGVKGVYASRWGQGGR